MTVATEPTYLGIRETRDYVASQTGRRPGEPTIRYWIGSGVRCQGGRVVRLAAQRVGGRWVISREAINRFLREIQSGSTEPAPAA